MASFKDSFSDLERHRKALEANVEKLRKSLDDWRLWELDYEALKEEVEALPSPPTAKDLATLHQGWDGMVLSKNEALEIIFGKAGKAHSASKIVQLLSRRIDYVGQNVSTLERQLETAENKLAAITVVSQPDALDENGLPITEIIEELDDDDNVLSHQLRTAGDTQPQLLDALEAVEEADGKVVASSTQSPTTGQTKASDDTEMADAEDTTSKARPAKKGVSFADDTKPGHDVNSVPANTIKPSYTLRRIEDIIQTVDEQDKVDLSNAVIPMDESAEDAALRREMLEYSLSEIGPVVAELNIEEGTDDEFDEDYDYSGEEDIDEEDDEDDDDDLVDHLGRSRSSVITDDYRERMMALEKKLGFKGYFTTNDDSDEAEEQEVQDHGIGRIAIKKATTGKGDAENIPEVTATKPSSGKPGVRFANELDIAPADSAFVFDPVHGQVRTSTEHEVEPLSDIVERSTNIPAPSTNLAKADSPTTKRVSRFEKTRDVPSNPSETHPPSFPDQPLPFRPATSSQPKLPAGPLDAPTRFLDQPLPFRPAPTGPDGQTLATQVIERETNPGSAVEPDELDAAMMHREVNEEYHRKRNRMIMKEGGFGPEEEQAIERIEMGNDDEDDEQPRRVSRFKAARLGR